LQPAERWNVAIPILASMHLWVGRARYRTLSDREPPNAGGDEMIMARAVLESVSNIAHSQKFNQ
jgi:hypothetical protein